MNMLFLYSGARRSQGTPGIDFPDTQLYGLNHMKEFGIEAETVDPFSWIVRIFPNSFGFRIKQFLSFFSTFRYDFVFGSSILYFLFLKRIFRPRTKYILFNLNIVRILMANKKQPLRFKSLRSSLMQADTIVSVSRAQNEKILEFIPELRGKLHFIPLGIDTAYFKPVYEGRGNTILSVGRDNGRDYKTVLDAAKLLPDRNFEIVCSRRNMEGMPPIPSNVTVHYDLPSEELRKKYVEAELLLLLTHPDDFTDGSDCSGQTVLLDACANGLPVIATRKKYIDDYLKEYEEVLLVDPYDTEDVVQKIDTLKSPELRRTMAERARKTAEGFSTERFAEELSGLCRRILNNG